MARNSSFNNTFAADTFHFKPYIITTDIASAVLGLALAVVATYTTFYEILRVRRWDALKYGGMSAYRLFNDLTRCAVETPWKRMKLTAAEHHVYNLLTKYLLILLIVNIVCSVWLLPRPEFPRVLDVGLVVLVVFSSILFNEVIRIGRLNENPIKIRLPKELENHVRHHIKETEIAAGEQKVEPEREFMPFTPSGIKLTPRPVKQLYEERPVPLKSFSTTLLPPVIERPLTTADLCKYLQSLSSSPSFTVKSSPSVPVSNLVQKPLLQLAPGSGLNQQPASATASLKQPSSVSNLGEQQSGLFFKSAQQSLTKPYSRLDQFLNDESIVAQQPSNKLAFNDLLGINPDDRIDEVIIDKQMENFMRSKYSYISRTKLTTEMIWLLAKLEYPRGGVKNECKRLKFVIQKVINSPLNNPLNKFLMFLWFAYICVVCGSLGFIIRQEVLYGPYSEYNWYSVYTSLLYSVCFILLGLYVIVMSREGMGRLVRGNRGSSLQFSIALFLYQGYFFWSSASAVYGLLIHLYPHFGFIQITLTAFVICVLIVMVYTLLTKHDSVKARMTLCCKGNRKEDHPKNLLL